MTAPPSPAGRTEPARPRRGGAPAIVCLSHLRWDFVFQRPQHLLGRAARTRPVLFIEEPVFDSPEPFLEKGERPEGVLVAVPHLPRELPAEEIDREQRRLLDELLAAAGLDSGDFVLWYYTPMAQGFAAHLAPRAIVYDVMDELSLFRGAPPLLVERETELYRRADIVFTGGASLYAAKRDRHPNVHLFPSSIDAEHFVIARTGLDEPADQRGIPGPRLGFFGVIDERMDLVLLDDLAAARPDWQIVMVGPVVKIEPAELPVRHNLHYLGPRPYADLPRYIAGWEVALMPWALNESTRFISPTKTPEYLAAGRPVVSTPVKDVVEPYGAEGLVHIASTADEFVRGIEAALSEPESHRAGWLERVDRRLAATSWDRTWAGMDALIEGVLTSRRGETAPAGGRGESVLDSGKDDGRKGRKSSTGTRAGESIHPERGSVAAD